MTRDLEETLNELGPGYREVVGRLKSAYRPMAAPVAPVAPRGRRAPAYLAAASLLLAVGLCAVFGVLRRGAASGPGAPSRVYTVRASTAENEYRLAVVRNDASVQEMIRTQRPDGSWKNDFLTKRNAEVLKDCPGEEAQIAYRKAIRNLRVRGVITD
jgi:hypothetical protein